MKNKSQAKGTPTRVLSAETLTAITAGGRGCIYADVRYSDGSIIEQGDGNDHKCVDGTWTNAY